MEATMMKQGLLFELGNGVLRVVVATDPERGVEHLLYTVGKSPTRKFTRERGHVRLASAARQRLLDSQAA